MLNTRLKASLLWLPGRSELDLTRIGGPHFLFALPNLQSSYNHWKYLPIIWRRYTFEQQIFTCPWAWKSVSHLENTKAFMAIAATWSQLLLVTPSPWHVRTSLLQFSLHRDLTKAKAEELKILNLKKGLYRNLPVFLQGSLDNTDFGELKTPC